LILVVDGNSIINRAFYGIKLLTTKDGRFTNAVYGFLNMLDAIREQVKPDGIAVAFDMRGKTFRHEMYEPYKAGRKGMPEELAAQLPVTKEVLAALGCEIVTCPGFEADDILGAYAAACEQAGEPCVIATGDRDSLQLVRPNVSVRIAKTTMGAADSVLYDEQKIQEEYGVPPKALIDVKALAGDSSDNIPGVAGVGPKTACDLIAKFGSLDGVYELLESPDIKDGVRKKLTESRENAYISKKLGTIVTDLPLKINLDELKARKRDDTKLHALFVELEFFKLLKKYGLENVAAETPAAVKTTVEVKRDSRDIYDLKDYHKQHLDEVLPENIFDPMLAAYLINPLASNYALDRLLTEYGCGEDGFDLLCQVLSDKVDDMGMTPLLRNIEQPLAVVLGDMEIAGIRVEKEGLERYGAEMTQKAETVKQEIYELAGEEFNIGSPKQLSYILFEKLGLPTARKTKSGYSTDADVLANLAPENPIVEKVLLYRQYTKLISTYCEGLAKEIAEDGRIHTTFIQTETRTGRISSAEPNLQNIPVRTELGRQLREFFVAEPGYVLLDADYSQIELRVLAAVAGDENMKAAFASGLDIHTKTASEVFGLPEVMINSTLRSRAKAVNFGIVYGIGAYSLSRDIGVTVAEADRYIKNYLAAYPAIAEFLTDTVEQAKKDGFVSTYFGRRRPLPELGSSNMNIRNFGERAAKNTAIQGTAADIIKIAMIRVAKRLKDEGLKARLILQIHDELIVEAPTDEADFAAVILKEEMERAAELGVSLAADVSSGQNWLQAKN